MKTSPNTLWNWKRVADVAGEGCMNPLHSQLNFQEIRTAIHSKEMSEGITKRSTSIHVILDARTQTGGCGREDKIGPRATVPTNTLLVFINNTVIEEVP